MKYLVAVSLGGGVKVRRARHSSDKQQCHRIHPPVVWLCLCMKYLVAVCLGGGVEVGRARHSSDKQQCHRIHPPDG